jgi:hypothetical protein
VLLRSLVHRLLTLPEPPSHLRDKRWVYRGQQLRLCTERGGTGRGRFVTSITAEVTPGAKQALVRRSRALGVRPTSLVRGAIIDLLEGRTKQLVIVGTVGDMWDDPDRYWREME